MRILHVLNEDVWSELTVNLDRTDLRIERVATLAEARLSHARAAADAIVFAWEHVDDDALRSLASSIKPPQLVAVAERVEGVAPAIAAGVDEVVVRGEPHASSRIALALARAARAGDLRRELASFRAVTARDTGLRYLEIDLLNDRFRRVGEVESSSRRFGRAELERSNALALLDAPSRENFMREVALGVSRYYATGELGTIVLDVALGSGNVAHGTRRIFVALALDEDGRPTVARGFSWDTTDIVSSREDYKRLFEAAHDAIVVFEPEGEIVLDANARACDLYRVPRHVLVGSSLRSVSTDPARSAKRTEETLRSGSVIRFEAEQVRRDGSRLTVEINASRIEYQGRPAILSVNRDVTGQRLAESARRRHEQTLAQAQKMEALGRLAGGIAHDFNNLVMVISTCSEVLGSTIPEGDPTRIEIDDIVDAADRAKRLVSQLLAFGRRTPQTPRPVDLSDVVLDLEGLLRRVASEEIELVTKLESELPSVLADASQLEQLLVNLIVNARDAIQGPGTITIRTTRSESGVVLVVSDTGTGMDEETKARIFEPFFTTKEQGKGTGLGLSTVYGIVRDAGGTIVVESAPGVGTTFRVTLPIHEAPPESVRRDRSARVSQPGTERILLVEDERAVRRILARELTRFGYDVVEAADGAAALEVAKLGRFDVLVTDVVMPKMSGDVLAERLKAEWPDILVVFISGHTDRGQVRDVSARGLGTLLKKPFHPSELIEIVRLGLATQRSA